MFTLTGDRMGFRREFVIDSKLFSVVREGGLIRITERGRRFKQELLFGLGTAQWLGGALEGCVTDKRDEFFSSRREGYRSFIMQRSSNSRGRFVKVAVYGDGGRNCCIIIPEEEGSNGWSKLREVLRESLQIVKNSHGKPGEALKRGGEKVISYREALLKEGTHAGSNGAGGGTVHRAHRDQSRETECGRDVRKFLTLVRDMQEQLRMVQEEVSLVRKLVEAFKEGGETVSFRGNNVSWAGGGLGWKGGAGWAGRGPKPMDHRRDRGYKGKGWNGFQVGRPWAGPGPQLKTTTRQEWARVTGNPPGHGSGDRLLPESSSCRQQNRPVVHQTAPMTPSDHQKLPEVALNVDTKSNQQQSFGQRNETTPSVVPSPPRRHQNMPVDQPAATQSRVDFMEPQTTPIEPLVILPSPPSGCTLGGSVQNRPTGLGEEGEGPASPLGVICATVTVENSEGGEEGDSASELFLSDEEGSQRLLQGIIEHEGEGGSENGGVILEGQKDFRIQNPIPLNCMYPDPSSASDWVFQTVNDIKDMVGLKCEGYEEQFMALLTAIEVGHQQQRKTGSKKQRELNRLTWSMNSEGSSSRERSKGKGLAYSNK
ncbi:hypothetical protein I3842_12G056500 [Carya illinoinensis]|uniref:Uncharacterized protein n=1 Tax=Carya illinoinensis TaxID=32201 RepID=A0A922IVC5_CARIL|nr:hypothetical protein I3842_12G056500 [Carya illinoinensis]